MYRNGGICTHLLDPAVNDCKYKPLALHNLELDVY